MTLRSIVVSALLVLTAAGCGSGSQDDTKAASDPTTPAASSSSPDASQPPSSTASPATEDADADDPTSCGHRLVNPRETIPGKTFARCVLDAQEAAGSATVETTYADGTGGGGVVSFRKPTAIHVMLRPQGEIIIIGRDGWLKDAQGWVKANQGGGVRAKMAHAVVQAWVVLTDRRVQQGVFTSTEWKPTGRTKEIHGVEARGYAGNPTLPGLTLEKYVVWLSAQDLTVRVDAIGSAMGQRVVSQQDFTDWGKPVTIEPPQ